MSSGDCREISAYTDTGAVAPGSFNSSVSDDQFNDAIGLTAMPSGASLGPHVGEYAGTGIGLDSVHDSAADGVRTKGMPGSPDRYNSKAGCRGGRWAQYEADPETGGRVPSPGPDSSSGSGSSQRDILCRNPMKGPSMKQSPVGLERRMMQYVSGDVSGYAGGKMAARGASGAASD